MLNFEQFFDEVVIHLPQVDIRRVKQYYAFYLKNVDGLDLFFSNVDNNLLQHEIRKEIAIKFNIGDNLTFLICEIYKKIFQP